MYRWCTTHDPTIPIWLSSGLLWKTDYYFHLSLPFFSVFILMFDTTHYFPFSRPLDLSNLSWSHGPIRPPLSCLQSLLKRLLHYNSPGTSYPVTIGLFLHTLPVNLRSSLLVHVSRPPSLVQGQLSDFLPPHRSRLVSLRHPLLRLSKLMSHQVNHKRTRHGSY